MALGHILESLGDPLATLGTLWATFVCLLGCTFSFHFTTCLSEVTCMALQLKRYCLSRRCVPLIPFQKYPEEVFKAHSSAKASAKNAEPTTPKVVPALHSDPLGSFWDPLGCICDLLDDFGRAWGHVFVDSKACFLHLLVGV